MASRTRLGVVGWPVAHSRSPAIHNAALKALGLTDWRYQLLPVAPELFAETVTALPPAGFRGVNVTIPHKQAALALADEPTPVARAIGAANTLTFGDGGQIRADNTDAPALTQALPFSAAGKDVMILGAGGSARAAVWALLDAGAAVVRVYNRTAERARALCEELGGTAVGRIEAADVLVNCTSIGLDAGTDPFKELPLTADELANFACVVDLVYSDSETNLVQAARARAIPVVDGLELLVAQAALSFELFTSRSAPVQEMRAAVRQP
jgi:shikimate dehydrogenase